MDMSTQALDQVIRVGYLVALFGLAAIAYFLVRREIRKGIASLRERLSSDIKTFLESTKSDVRPIIKEGFVTAGNALAVTFADTMERLIVPAIKTSLGDASAHIKVWASRNILKPVDSKTEREAAANIQVFVDSGDYDGVVSYIELMPDKNKRASYYYELAVIYMGKQDRYRSISAVHKYKEITGDTPEGYRVLAYVYWWFGDFDTALIHAGHALRLADALPDSSAKNMVLGKLYSALAYYYAEKEIEKEKAFSYIAKCFEEPFVDSKKMAANIDTRGFVSLRFGNTENEINAAITDFNRRLEIEPDSIITMKHLREAYEKKRELKNKRA